MFSKWSSSSMSRAIVTPSLVIVGAPNFLSSTTLRPFGPSVTLTVSASLLTPASSRRLALLVEYKHLGHQALDLREHVTAREDEELLAVDGDLGSAVLRVDDLVADGHVQGDELAGVLGTPTRAYRENLALLGLLLRRVGDDKAGCGRLFGLARPNDDAVVQGLQLHFRGLLSGSVSTLDLRVPTIPARRRWQPRGRECYLELLKPQVRDCAGIERGRPGPLAAGSTRRPRSWRRCPCTWRGSGGTSAQPPSREGLGETRPQRGVGRHAAGEAGAAGPDLLSAAARDFATSTSTTASWNEAATSALETSGWART